MVFILAASSLHHAIKTALSFNPNAVKVRTTAQFQLSHFFCDKTRLVIGHDVVNNSLSRHRSNNNKPLTPSQLTAVLEKYQKRIEAIVYCPREETPDIYDQLKRSSLVTIHIVKDIVSRRKQKDPMFTQRVQSITPKACAWAENTDHSLNS